MPKSPPSHNASADDFIPAHPTLTKLRVAVQLCQACDLYAHATQAVFGEGPSRATTMLVGEQPGDVEDREGHTFVGPAGHLLDRALDAAGFDRDELYLTNAVKHFKWAKDARSIRRIHKAPNASEVRACMPWLEQEIAVVRPRLIICLGAIAAKALLGRTFSVMKSRGIPIQSPWAEIVVATVHPSAVLRTPSNERRRAERMFIADLRRASKILETAANAAAGTTRGARNFRTWPTTAHPSAISSARTRSSPA